MAGVGGAVVTLRRPARRALGLEWLQRLGGWDTGPVRRQRCCWLPSAPLPIPLCMGSGDNSEHWVRSRWESVEGPGKVGAPIEGRGGRGVTRQHGAGGDLGETLSWKSARHRQIHRQWAGERRGAET